MLATVRGQCLLRGRRHNVTPRMNVHAAGPRPENSLIAGNGALLARRPSQRRRHSHQERSAASEVPSTMARMTEDDPGGVLAVPYIRVIGRALGWMTLDEVRECAARVHARGGRVSGMLDDDKLAKAHPHRVHAILQSSDTRIRAVLRSSAMEPISAAFVRLPAGLGGRRGSGFSGSSGPDLSRARCPDGPRVSHRVRCSQPAVGLIQLQRPGTNGYSGPRGATP